MEEHFKLEVPRKPFWERVRICLVKEGLLKPKSLKESQELFPFPVEKIEQPKLPLWVINNIEKVTHSPFKS